MRISDWSSDVCSSDLLVDADCAADDGAVLAAPAVDDALELRCAQMGQLREQQLEERQIAPAQGLHDGIGGGFRLATVLGAGLGLGLGRRSEEHTSELQSLMRRSYAVFCLNKKKCT